MKSITIAILFFSAFKASAGSLYSFEYNDVLLSSLTQIQTHFLDLQEKELKPQYIKPSFTRDKKLLVTAFFSYKAENELGIAFACSKVDENGVLIGAEKDIQPKKSSFFNSGAMPITDVCTQPVIRK